MDCSRRTFMAGAACVAAVAAIPVLPVLAALPGPATAPMTIDGVHLIRGDILLFQGSGPRALWPNGIYCVTEVQEGTVKLEQVYD